MIENVTIGADPELFFEQNGKPLSVEGLVGGTKENPRKIGNKGCYLQEDNVMAEFNIPPCKTKKEFKDNIFYMLDLLDTIAMANNSSLLINPSAEFDKKSLNTIQAKEFGCSPDLNAYSFMENERVEIKDNLRVAGGHIHIGYENPSNETSLKLVRALDIFLGLPSILLDDDVKRKKYYGFAGSYRIKDYGVEYRTLSNFWLTSETLVEWVYTQIELAIEFVNSNRIFEISQVVWDEIELAINDNDSSLALAVEEKINNLLIIK